MAAKILLTGRPGIGKTTVCDRVVRKLGRTPRGFVTREISAAGRREGFLLRSFYADETVLSHVEFDGPKVGKYGVNLASLTELVVPELEAALEAGPGQPVVVDEIGKMELKSDEFAGKVPRLIEAPNPLLATVPGSGPELVERIKANPATELLEVREDNRDELPGRLIERLG